LTGIFLINKSVLWIPTIFGGLLSGPFGEFFDEKCPYGYLAKFES